MKRLTMIVLGVLAAGGAQLGWAEQGQGIRLSEAVGYGELDLTKIEGVKVLHRRLHRAAEQVCEPLASRGLWRHSGYRQCVADALSQAVMQVNQPLLTRYHESRHDGAPVQIVAR